MSTVRTFSEEEAFAHERRKYIGGSDVANLYNLEPYYCGRRLAYFKMSNKDGSAMFTPDMIFYGNKPTKRGQMFERLAAEVYSEETGRKVRKGIPKADPLLPFLRPQPDFDILNDARGDVMGAGTLSIKAPGREMFMRLKQAINSLTDHEPKSEWAQKQAEAGRLSLLPYELQLQTEIGAQGRKWGSFGLLWADQLELVKADYDRDETIIMDIRLRAKEFWDKKERGDIEAFPRLDAKSKQCSKCEFRITCQSENLLKMLQSEEKGGASVDIPIFPILDQLRDTLREREALADEAKELVDETKDEIRDVLRAGGADCGEAETTRVYNRLQKGRESLQKAPMLKFLAEKSGLAEKALKKIDKEGLMVPPDVLDMVNLLVELPDLITKKFVTTGAPFPVLKVLDIRKNMTKGSAAVQ